jgi:hypothetical protein
MRSYGNFTQQYKCFSRDEEHVAYRHHVAIYFAKTWLEKWCQFPISLFESDQIDESVRLCHEPHRRSRDMIRGM